MVIRSDRGGHSRQAAYDEHALIREVRGHGETEAKRVDRSCREICHKKDEAIVFTAEQARLLKRL